MRGARNQIYRLTVGDYYRMGDVGILPLDARVELVDGAVFDMPPIGSRHAWAVEHLAQLLRQAVGNVGIVRAQNPVRLDEYSEVQPDIALVRPREDAYRSSHPGPDDVLLLVELADATLRYDRDTKVPLYARHGIPEVWIVDLEAGRLLRYRDARQGAYLLEDEPDSTESVSVGSLPDLRLDLGGLFA